MIDGQENHTQNSLKAYYVGAGEMALNLRELVTLAEDLGLSLSNNLIAHIHVPGDLTISSDIFRHQACMWYTHILVNKTVKKIKLK